MPASATSGTPVMTKHAAVESRIVRYANRIMVAAGKDPAIDSFEAATRYILQTDTVLNALEEYMDCSIPGACKGARSMEERHQNLAAVLSFLEDRVLHMSLKHISASRILQGSAKDISNLIECVGSLISLEWHPGEDPSTQYVSLRKVSRTNANPLLDLPINLPDLEDKNSDWLPRLPHVLGEPICSTDAQPGGGQRMHALSCNLSDSPPNLQPEELWPDPPWPHCSPNLTDVEDHDGSLYTDTGAWETQAVPPCDHHQTSLIEELQQQQPLQGAPRQQEERLISPTGDKPEQLARSVRKRRSGAPSTAMMDNLPCSKPWLPSGKSGVGLVSKCVDMDNEESTRQVIGTLDLKKKKNLQNGFTGGCTRSSRAGKLTVTQRAVNRSDRVMEIMIGDLENLKLELRALQTANKENASSDSQQTIDTQVLRAGVQKLDIRVHQLEKAQGQLRKAWHAP